MPRLGATILLLAAAWPLAAAAPAVGQLEFTPPASASGEMALNLSPGGFAAMYHILPGGVASFQLTGEPVQMEIVDVTDDFLIVGGTQVCQLPCGESNVEPRPLESAATAIRLVETLANFTFAVQPHEAATVAIGDGSIRRVVEDPVVSSGEGGSGTSVEPFATNSISWPNRYYMGAYGSRHHVTTQGMAGQYEGLFSVVIAGAIVRVENETGPYDIRTGSWREHAPDDPSGVSQQRFRVHHVALAGLFRGVVTFDYAGAYGNLLGRELTLHNVSKLSIPLADARVNISGQDYTSAERPFLDIEGLFDVRLPNASIDSSAAEHGVRIRADVAGDIVRIAENRLAVREFPTAVVLGGAAGAGLLLAAYAVFSWVRRGAVYIAVRALEWKLFTFVPFAAKLDVTKVLVHPVRQGIMAMLSGTYAMRNLADLRREVAAAYDISTMAAYLHLRTLWRANHLTVVRLGSRHFIGPNSGGMGPKEQRVAASLLHRPEALAAARYLCLHPGATQGEVVAHVQGACSSDGMPVSRDTALKWVRRLETVKLTPTHLVRAFGASLNRNVDPKDVKPVQVGLVVRRADPSDARVVRYEPTDVLYDVVATFTHNRHELGAALEALTRMRVQRRSNPAREGTSAVD